jgi:serine protease Do
MQTARTLAGLSLALGLLAPPAVVAQPGAQSRAGTLAEFSRSLQELSDRVSPSVVQIFVTAYAAPDDEDRSASGEPIVERTSGSGVIVDPDGYIVTNAHVVENATRLEVELPAAAASKATSILKRRGRTAGAQVVAIDHETDIAVIKVEAANLPALPFGDSDDLRPGQIVLAFGSPLGLQISVTMGVISAVARQLTPEDPMIYVQTDAPINPGNSGGALVDTNGRLVGINTLIYSQGGGNEGIGFAAPSNIVRNVFTQIRKTGRVRRGEIGIYSQTVTPLLAEALGISTDAGVILSDVVADGPAARAGLRPGDLVISLDGKRMENGRQLRINLYTRGAGETVVILAQRGATTLTARVGVAERPDDSGRLSELITQQSAVPALGILALDLSPRVAALLPPLRRDQGVVVATVSAAAPYSQQGRLQAGDVIYSLNGRSTGKIADLNSATAALEPGTPAVLQLERQGTLMYLAFRAERGAGRTR